MANLFKHFEHEWDVLQGMVDSIQSKSLHQAVKAICAILAKIETIDITKAMEKLERIIANMKVL